MAEVYAHSREDAPESDWEPLEAHLREVARRARVMSDAFRSGDWGYVAGLWHDLGKFRPEFQRRLRGSPEHAPHAAMGAALAAEARLVPIAFAIAGHHAGLANAVTTVTDGPRPLREAVADGTALLEANRAAVPAGLCEAPALALPPFLAELRGRAEEPGAATFWIRFLFSALVDADRLATEAFYQGERRERMGPRAALAVLRDTLDAHLNEFEATSAVNELRRRILSECRDAAESPPGFFSLTVPTGGGKTLATLSFALRHAVRHGQRRVIVVAPFTSIIDQNAAVYRSVLGADAILEHHSALRLEGAEESQSPTEVRCRLLAENWDAPVIVTTAVQFLESLFAHEPSRCRKLHNVARSVIVLDEAQTLPVEFLRCTLDALRELVRAYGCSIVLSTATQPALQRRTALPEGIEEMREIVSSPEVLAAAMRRVRVEWPRPGETRTTREVAGSLSAFPQVLAIVHRRRDAADIARALPCEGRMHLSTRMCPAHRLETLAAVRERLRAGEECRLVATQLVEAGVDLDFPVVYRAMAGLDSLAQAAGRCNREGRLRDAAGIPTLGRFVVYRADSSPPAGILQKGFEVAEAMLANQGDLDLFSPAVHEEYFRRLYMTVSHDARNIVRERDAMNFATVSRLFRLIADQGHESLVVPWGSDIQNLAHRFVQYPTRERARALQQCAVQVRPHELRELQDMGAVSPLEGFGFLLVPPYEHLYHTEFGLQLGADTLPDPMALMI